MTRGKRTWIFVIASAAALVAIVAASFALLLARPSGPAQASAGDGDGIGTAKYMTADGAGTVSANAVTIPNWGSSFTDPTNGVTYPYSMVGTNPASETSTTVPFVIIPLDFTFDNAPTGVNPTLAGSSKVPATVASPVFQGTADIGAATSTASAAPTDAGVAPSPRLENEPSDTTQVGDAFVRAQWNKVGTGYHVLLGQPTVLATQSISVPKNQGVMVVGSRSHARIGLMSYYWFSAHLQNLMVSMHIPATVVPLFLTYNTFLYIGSTSNCCVLGYHGAMSSLNGNGHQQVNTYMFAAYSDGGIFGANDGDNGFSYIRDIHALSHEVTEWLDDPFINNEVNPWLTPTAPQYGCTTDLETGDPVVGFGFTVTMPGGAQYHPEDEVFFSWFARQDPSISSVGYYTYLNNFAGVAQGC
ncbi:MAG TPA: hypothetical protein VFQ25_08485 [Ktedonobacterales bacterium]|nr:hypothetical protein [Ktedonobacterales bacterium]